MTDGDGTGEAADDAVPLAWSEPRRGLDRRGLLGAVGAGVALGTTGSLGGGTGGPAVTTVGEVLAPPTKGEADAPVTVAGYEDFACPHCATFAAELEPQIVSEYVDQGAVRLEHRDFPIPVREPASFEAANAARAVQDRADDAAFFAYADRLFANQSDLGPETYASLAEAVAGDRVRRAAEGRVYPETVRGDMDRCIDRGVSGTPAVTVDGNLLEDLTWDNFERAVAEARSTGASNGD